ncbi:MAG: hypothetical protein F4W90_07995 [Gammaproteobacteria bacterium]|nr:hypothetical protein [Gammaproteobacteria bacterium]
MARNLDLADPQLDDRMRTFIERVSGTDVQEIEGTKRLVINIPEPTLPDQTALRLERLQDERTN